LLLQSIRIKHHKSMNALQPADRVPALSLSTLNVGETGVVTAVVGPLAIGRRLLEMGLCPGTVITVLRRAPLGDPIEIRVRDYLLSLRLDQAAYVTLNVTTPTPLAKV
jgi:ferrous iron transport protein A